MNDEAAVDRKNGELIRASLDLDRNSHCIVTVTLCYVAAKLARLANLDADIVTRMINRELQDEGI